MLYSVLTLPQTIKPADIATVRKLAKPPHLIMRIMDCCLLLFQKRVDLVTVDPERRCVKPSWGEAMKVINDLAFTKDTAATHKLFIKSEITHLYPEFTGRVFKCESQELNETNKSCNLLIIYLLKYVVVVFTSVANLNDQSNLLLPYTLLSKQ